jgi:hypothetical protein
LPAILTQPTARHRDDTRDDRGDLVGHRYRSRRNSCGADDLALTSTAAISPAIATGHVATAAGPMTWPYLDRGALAGHRYRSRRDGRGADDLALTSTAAISPAIATGPVVMAAGPMTWPSPHSAPGCPYSRGLR